jgi:hypothetical protein
MKTFLITTIAFLVFTITTSKAQWTLTGASIYPTTITNLSSINNDRNNSRKIR